MMAQSQTSKKLWSPISTNKLGVLVSICNPGSVGGVVRGSWSKDGLGKKQVTPSEKQLKKNGWGHGSNDRVLG
jgi:hypothetical protein